MSSLLLTLIFGQLLVPGQAGPTDGLILGNPAASAPAFLDTFARTGTLPCDDPNTVACVTWLPDGGGLYDSKGNSWTENGTVPQVWGDGASPLYPNGYSAAPMAGAGPYGAASYYSAPLGNSFGGGWTAAFSVYLTNISDDQQGIGIGVLNTRGWMVDFRNAGTMRVYIFTNGGNCLVQSSQPTSLGLHLITLGEIDASHFAVKIDGDPAASLGCAGAVPPTAADLLSLGAGPQNWLAGGVVTGFWLSSTPATTENLDAISSQYWGLVADTGQTLSFSRASTATGVIDGRIWTWPAGVPRIGTFDDGTGLEVEGSGTNLILYSNAFGSWTAAGVTVTDAGVLAPDQSVAWLLTTSDGGHLDSNLYSDYDGGYTGSVYCTAQGGSAEYTITEYDNLHGNYCTQDCTASAGAWSRCVCASALQGGHSTQLRIYPGGDAGAGAVVCSDAQEEQSPAATSYIPTSGTTAARVADSVTAPWPSSVHPDTSDWSWSSDLYTPTGATPGVGYAIGIGNSYFFDSDYDLSNNRFFTDIRSANPVAPISAVTRTGGMVRYEVHVAGSSATACAAGACGSTVSAPSGGSPPTAILIGSSRNNPSYSAWGWVSRVCLSPSSTGCPP